MYKMCDRCRFSVPSKQPLCHVCGSREFASDELPALKPIAAGLQNCKESLSGAMGKVQSVFFAIGKEIEETAYKAQRATTTMRKLMFEAGDEHDQVLSFHRNIGAGRNVHFAPVYANDLNTVEPVQTTSAALLKSMSAQLEPLVVSAKSSFVSDDNLFSPKLSFVEYMAAHSVVGHEDEVQNDHLVLEDFSSIFKELVLRTPVVTIEAPQSVATEEVDVDSLRKNIDALQGWFESYGKEGLLVKTELTIAKTTSLPVAEAAQTTTASQPEDESAHESSRQAA